MGLSQVAASCLSNARDLIPGICHQCVFCSTFGSPKLDTHHIGKKSWSET